MAATARNPHGTARRAKKRRLKDGCSQDWLPHFYEGVTEASDFNERRQLFVGLTLDLCGRAEPVGDGLAGTC